MSKGDNPLGRLEGAKEEGYFRQKDAELLDALRAKMAHETTAEAIKSETQVDNDALLIRLAELGITVDTIRVLHLIPLLDVAWADGEIQEVGHQLLLEAAEATGVTSGDARTLFEGMLETAPKAELVEAAVDFIAHLLDVLPEADATVARDNLLGLSWKVADACGGVFGLWGRVEAGEREALRRIGERLSELQPDAAKTFLDRL